MLQHWAAAGRAAAALAVRGADDGWVSGAKAKVSGVRMAAGGGDSEEEDDEDDDEADDDGTRGASGDRRLRQTGPRRPSLQQGVRRGRGCRRRRRRRRRGGDGRSTAGGAGRRGAAPSPRLTARSRRLETESAPPKEEAEAEEEEEERRRRRSHVQGWSVTGRRRCRARGTLRPYQLDGVNWLRELVPRA